MQNVHTHCVIELFLTFFLHHLPILIDQYSKTLHKRDVQITNLNFCRYCSPIFIVIFIPLVIHTTYLYV